MVTTPPGRSMRFSSLDRLTSSSERGGEVFGGVAGVSVGFHAVPIIIGTGMRLESPGYHPPTRNGTPLGDYQELNIMP
jgi:hypothetical protein